MPRRARTRQPIEVESITHDEASRRNLPSAEHQPLMAGPSFDDLDLTRPRDSGRDVSFLYDDLNKQA